jgi:2,3-bisphosphoglycerate-independent phosphoglycerate mutase
MTPTKTPTLLCILDGWGQRDAQVDNAIAQARPPHFDALMVANPHGLINASEHFVGLPKGQMGNSEVGHMNIGCGRPVRQLLPRINEAIADGSLVNNTALQAFIQALKTSGGACHLMGLCSDGGVHAHLQHIITLANLVARENVPVWLHIITDGRDTAPTSARDNGFVQALVTLCAEHPNIRIASVSGRYYAMDRDHNWERVQHAYDAFTQGIGFEGKDAISALEAAYARGETDEFIKPTVLEGYERMEAADGVLMANFRPDRARHIMQAFTMEAFDGFPRPHGIVAHALGIADYWSEDCPLTIPAMFPLEQVSESLGEVLATHGKTQLRIAESEKFNHVTYFFSGGNGQFAGEERIFVPSPSVPTYDLQPEMSAPEVTDKLVAAIRSRAYDFIVVNYANPDMVGHTGNHAAVVKAIEAVDACLGRVADAMREVGGTWLITADHGNAEQTKDEKGQPHTQHTTNLVPLIAVGLKDANVTIREKGALSDLAPTLLTLMNLPIPAAMTGTSLLVPSTLAHDDEDDEDGMTCCAHHAGR